MASKQVGKSMNTLATSSQIYYFKQKKHIIAQLMRNAPGKIIVQWIIFSNEQLFSGVQLITIVIDDPTWW